MSSYNSTILITGGTTGLGFECARQIAIQSPQTLVIISARSDGEDKAEAINRETRRTNVKFLRLDLGELSKVRTFVSDFAKAEYPPLSALVLNAALQFQTIQYTPDGIEKTFGIAHVGHVLLFYLLAPHLNADARVVITSSGTHDPKQRSGLPDAKYDSGELMAHPDEPAKKKPQQRYSSAKLCNVLWTYAFERHRKAQNLQWTVNAMDPGLMPGTGLARDMRGFLQFIWIQIMPKIIPLLRLILSPNIHLPQESGKALARLAISPEVDGISGKYFEGLKEVESSKDSYDVEKQEDLWNWTAEFLGKDAAEKEAFKKLNVGVSSSVL